MIKAAGQNINVGVSTANFNSASVVDAATNIANLYSGQNNYSGNLTLTGDVRTYTGLHTYADGTVVGGTGTLSQASGSTVMNNVAMNKAYFVNAGNTLTLNSGKTLSVNGGIGIDARSSVNTSVVGGGTLLIPVGATATITGGNDNDVYFDNVTLNNSGLFNLNQPNGGHVTVLNNGAVFNNLASGEVRFSGADNQLITTAGAGTLNNAGLIKAAGQNINVGLSVANYNSGTVIDAGSSTANLYAAQNNYSGNASLAGDVRMAGGTHAISGVISVGTGSTWSASGGTINLEDGAVLNLDNNLQFTGGTINLTGTGAGATIASGSSLTLTGNTLGGNGLLTNLGTFNLSSGNVAGSLVNRGALNANSGTNVIAGADLQLAGGIVTISGGATLQKNGGSATWSDGVLTGAGSFDLVGGAGFSFQGNGVRVLNGPTLAATTLNLTGGSLEIQSGTLSVSGGTLDTGSALNLSGGTLVNSGTLKMMGNVTMENGSLGGPGPIELTGVLTKTGSSAALFNQVFDNRGSVQVLAGGMTLSGGGNHTGTFLASAGALVDFDSGLHTFANGSSLEGSGQFDGGGTLNLIGTGSGLTVGAGTLLDLNAMAFSGTGALTNRGTVTGNLASLPGDFINQTGATANLQNTSIGGNAYNYGTVNVTGLVTIAGPIAQQLGGVINLPTGGNLDMSNPTGLFSWNDGTIAGTGAVGFSGGGSFNFAGNGQRVIDGLNFSFNNLTLPNGSLTLKSGSLTLSGATVLPTGVALNLEGGLLTNNGSLDVAGTFGLTGGAFAGPGTLNMTGGSMNLPAGNNVTWTNSGLLTNTGTLNLAGSSITNAIDNQGTINLGNGLSFVNPVTNTGTLVAQAGTTTLFSSGLTQQAGGLLQLNNGELSGNINLANGSISGSGTINGNLVVGSATLAPGFSPGAITITGNLTMDANSVLNIELGGPGRGTGYDWINVLGTAQLAGTLNVTSYNGFTPPAGSSYNVMQFASKTGNFATLNLPVARSLVVSNLPTSIMLAMPELVAPAPAPTPVPAAPQAPAPAAVAQVIVAETRLEEVQELVADLKVEPPRKSDKEPEVEACP